MLRRALTRAPLDVARLRLANQRLIGAPFARPEEVVAWLGAVQAQDYSGAKWAIAQRTRGCSDVDLEQAVDRGRIVRTHVLRPTWHFVAPADVRWMLALTAPRVHAAMAYYHRQHDLDERTLGRSDAALVRALQGGKALMRTELARALADAGIAAHGVRLGHLLAHAELDALICSGPRRGKQPTWALLDERVPPTPPRARDEALAELTRRYFTSHGPALAVDFAWWSGLTVGDARAGIAMVEGQLENAVVDGKSYWLAPSRRRAAAPRPVLHLLPNYDEYVVAYKDHSAAFDKAVLVKLGSRYDVLVNHIIVVDGRVVGGWRRLFEKRAAIVATKRLVAFDAAWRDALAAAGDRFGRFLGMPVKVR